MDNIATLFKRMEGTLFVLIKNLFKLYFKALFLASLSFTRIVLQSNSFILFAISCIGVIYLAYIIPGWIIKFTIKPIVFALRIGIMVSSLAALVYCILMYQSGTVDLDVIATNPQATESASEILFDKALSLVGIVMDRVGAASHVLTERLQKIILDSMKDSSEL